MLCEDDPWEARWTRDFEDAGVEELRLRRGAPAEWRGAGGAGLSMGRPIAQEAEALGRRKNPAAVYRGSLSGGSRKTLARLESETLK
jgi:hypothetical protein